MSPRLRRWPALLAVGLGMLAPGGAFAAGEPWRLSQDPAWPWKGTPRADMPDHRNGAALAGQAVFSDPRWAARAIAIELRDYHRSGARTAADYARRLEASCVRLGGADCARVSPAALAAPLAAGEAEDLQLFGAHDLPAPRLPAALVALAAAMTGETPSGALLEVAVGAVGDDDLDQSEASYRTWLKRDPSRPEGVRRLEAVLAEGGVLDVTPAWQLLRTGSDWRGCGAPFEIPPAEVRANIVPTLAIERDRFVKALGPVETKSAYRGPWLNLCAGGAEKSAHREFSAVDLTPLTPMTRQTLMTRICPVYAQSADADRLGLGFYSGVRFHIDTQRHRSWATENGRAYAPCASTGGVNPPLPALPRTASLPPAPPSR